MNSVPAGTAVIRVSRVLVCLLVATWLAAPTPLAAQDAQEAAPPAGGAVRFTTGGQVRVRSETWSNFGFTEGNDDTFILLRLLVDADLRVGEYVRAFVRLRSAVSTDRDLPGGRRGLEADDLDLQDAFVDLILPLASDVVLTARAGREGLLFGKQRLVSPLDWANTQRTFDGASVLVSSGDLLIRGFWAQPVVIQKTKFNRSDPARNLFGVHASDVLPNALPVLDLYWLGIVRDST
ncbi:MAG: alginate export family protein, partial [Gemmatimonadota bacterium]